MSDIQAAAEELLGPEIDEALAEENQQQGGETQQTDEEALLDELAAEDDNGEEGAEEGEQEEQQEEIPPAPASWSKDDAEAWKSLTPEAREVVSRRERERDSHIRKVTMDAAEQRKSYERDSIAAVAQHAENYARQLQVYAEQLLVPAPDTRLLYSGDENDRIRFYQQEAAHRESLAQHQRLQQEVTQSQQQAERARQSLTASEVEAEVEKLRDIFPEYLDPETGPNLQRELGAIGQELGYTPELFAQAGANDIMALKKAAEWRDDALKYRQLMAKRMEGVRAAKSLPKMARPGAARTAGQINAAAKEGNWEKVKANPKDTGAFADFLGL